MKRLASLVSLGCALAFALCLVGCASSSPSAPDPTTQSKEAFTGTWDLSGMEENGETTSSDDLATLKEYGLEVYLQLDEDGTATLDLFGEKMEGSWEPGTATEAKVTLDNDTVDMTISNDELSMTQGDSKLMFTKGEPRDEATDDAASGDAVAEDETASDESASSESAASDEAAAASGDASAESGEPASSEAAASDDSASSESAAN